MTADRITTARSADRCAADLVRAVGRRVAHVTARGNLPSIMARGLLPAADLAEQAGMTAAEIVLRDTRLEVGAARLNHQRPILHGITAARRMLDGHSPESRAAQLDRRVFLRPERKGHRFAASVSRDLETATLWLDTAGLARAMAADIDLSPINSGNFTQGGAHAARGDWIYVPLAEGLAAFRTNRIARRLVRAKDGVVEISLRRPVAPALLQALRREAP